MAFVPRLTAPSSTDKHWIQVRFGGYNPCIPIYGGPSVLPNCFTGETEIVTREGVKRLDSLVDKDIMVLSQDCTYRKAKGVYCGEQLIYRVSLQSGDSFLCTEDHRWIEHRDSYYKGKHYSKNVIVTTAELKRGSCIPFNMPSKGDLCIDGIRHGFIYGDGSLSCNKTKSKACLCGNKRNYMMPYFEGSEHICQLSNGTIECYYYPKEYKYIPDLTKDLTYLRSFICGLLASDGCVDSYGCPSISTVKRDDAYAIHNILSVLGYKSNVYSDIRDTNYKKSSEIFVIRIKKSFMSEDMFLNPIHRDRFLQKQKIHKYTKVTSVECINEVRSVYCVQEPETHTMTLNGGILTGQCVGYSHGRFAEILGATSCSLSTDNAGQWWYYTQDGYERGQEPRLGAVICWDRAGEAGHVAIVEQINPDGSIVTSNSAYNSTRFYTQTLSPPYYTWSSLYKLQGFIYNPNVDGGVGNKIQGFIEGAKNLVGEKMKKSLSVAVGVSVQMVTTCTKAVSGLSNVVIPIVSTPSALAKRGVEKGMGEFIEGPLFGNERTPQVGDIILLRTSEDREYKEKTDCDKLAIVCEAKDSNIDAVHVNSSNIVANTTYKTSYRAICGYYRPDWSKVNNTASAAFGYAPLGRFYESENTAEDATIREVGYLSTDYEPTTKKSGIKLSVVNYTTLLASFLDDLLVPSAISGNMGVNVITDALDNKVKITVDFLLNKGLNAAAACGVAGNIYYESNFNTAAIGDYGTSFGICQWHYGRGDNMKRVAGSDWKNNLSGQLNYLWQELQGAYSAAVLSVLNTVPNTLSGAKQAADVFVRRFEIPAYVDEESVRRQAKAAEYWNMLVIQMTTTSSGSSIISSDALSGKEVKIPSNIPQDGISAIYTNYVYFKWAYNQKKVYDLWKQSGSKQNRNIATLNGFYLIAVKPIFGTVGDKVSVILEDGTCINAIIADIKGNENGTTGAALYGHSSGSKYNIIEWEGIGDTTSVYLKNAIDLTGWAGKAVTKIINGGSIL